MANKFMIYLHFLSAKFNFTIARLSFRTATGKFVQESDKFNPTLASRRIFCVFQRTRCRVKKVGSVMRKN
jgi:hypothetical protein